MCATAPEQGLRAARRALEEDVSARERSDDDELDRAILAEHDLPDLALRLLAKVGETAVAHLPDQRHDGRLLEGGWGRWRAKAAKRPSSGIFTRQEPALAGSCLA
jgi:hypothetical protein